MSTSVDYTETVTETRMNKNLWTNA